MKPSRPTGGEASRVPAWMYPIHEPPRAARFRRRGLF